MKRKGLVFSPMLVLVVFAVLTSAFFILREKKTNFSADALLGEDIKDIIINGHDKLEKALVIIDHLAQTEASSIAFNLFQKGGFLGEDPPPCGVNQGFPIWFEKNKEIKECLPDFKNNFINEFDKEIKPRLVKVETLFPIDEKIVFDVPNTKDFDFEYSLIWDKDTTNFVGIGFGNIFTATPIPLSRPVNFQVQLPVNFLVFKTAIDGLNKIIESCSPRDDLQECLNEIKPSLPSEMLKWRLGDDCQGKQITERYVPFCVDLEKEYIYTEEPYKLNFAAYIPLGVDFEIVNFKFAKDIITEDKSFARTEEQLPLSFSGELHLNTPIGIDKLTGFLYKDDKKGPTITIEGAETQYSFSGEYQSKKGETHNIKLVFSAGEFIKSTPLLTVTVQ